MDLNFVVVAVAVAAAAVVVVVLAVVGQVVEVASHWRLVDAASARMGQWVRRQQESRL